MDKSAVLAISSKLYFSSFHNFIVIVSAFSSSYSFAYFTANSFIASHDSLVNPRWPFVAKNDRSSHSAWKFVYGVLWLFIEKANDYKYHVENDMNQICQRQTVLYKNRTLIKFAKTIRAQKQSALLRKVPRSSISLFLTSVNKNLQRRGD